MSGVFLEVKSATDEYIKMGDSSKENANMGWSPNGLLFTVGGESLKLDYLNRIREQGFSDLADLHLSGGVHIHDLSLGYVTPYCCGHSLFNLLSDGLTTGSTVSSPAKHFRSAVSHCINYIGASSNEYAGAQAFSDIDVYLAPYAYKCYLDYLIDTRDIKAAKKLTDYEIRQSIQELIYSLNFNTRYGGQPPFSNITLSITVPSDMMSRYAMVGGKLLNQYYVDRKDYSGVVYYDEHSDSIVYDDGDVREEHKLFVTHSDLASWQEFIVEAFLDNFINGDSEGKGFTFPVLTLNITDDFFLLDEKIKTKIYNLTAKFGTPQFQNFINGVSGGQRINVGDTRSMCPISGKEYVLIKEDEKIQFKQVEELDQKNHLVYSDGKFSSGFFKSYENKNMFRIQLCNGVELVTSDDHANFTKIDVSGEELVVETRNLTNEHFLPIYIKPYNCITNPHLQDDFVKKLTYILSSYIIHGEATDSENEVVFRIREEVFHDSVSRLEEAFRVVNYNCYSFITNYKNENKEFIVTFTSNDVKEFLSKYTCVKDENIVFSDNVFSIDTTLCLERLVDSLFYSRIYNPFSKNLKNEFLIKQIYALAMLVGVNDRFVCLEDEDGHYFSNESLDQIDHFKQDDYLYVRVKSVEDLQVCETAYCFTMKNKEEPRFVVASSGISTHNCRLSINEKEIKKHVGGIFGNAEQTGSLQVVTINLPYFAMECFDKSKTKDEILSSFFELLEKRMCLIRDEQVWKRSVVEKFFKQGLFPMSKSNFRRGFDTFFTTIGFIGLWETIQILNENEHSFLEDSGMELAKEILNFMVDKTSEFTKETGKLFNLEATPAESASYKLAKKSLKKFPNIPHGGTEESPYFVNSCHIPAEYQDRLDLIFTTQSQLQTIPSGGTVTHFYVGEKMTADEIETALKTICSTTIPFFSITTVYSICPICGYIAGAHEFCPNNHSEEELKKVNSDFVSYI